MARVAAVALGVLMLVAGAVWTMQGLGWIGDGGAEGGFRATTGPALAGLGVALVYVAARGPR